MLKLAAQAAFLIAALIAGSNATRAQTYPSRPITIIVTFPPGGSADIVARALDSKVSAALGQSLVIDNRPGAGGNIGIAAVAKAAPDGYTIGIAAAGVLAVNPHLNRAMPFDPQKDLAPITMLAEIPFVLVANPGTSIGSVADILAMARKGSDKLSIGHGGNGTAMHLTAALFTQRASVSIPFVAYRGTAPATTDVLGGHISLAVLDIPASLQLIRDGKLKAIGVSAAKRVPFLPEVPTLAESGLEGYESVGWFGLVAPAGTPPEIIGRLNSAFVKALEDPTVVEKVKSLGADATSSTPDAFGRFIRSESDKWGKVVAQAGIKAE